MHTVTFYPLGNADTSKIDLPNGRTLLFDYANTRDPDDATDLRIDLAKQLRAELSKAGRKSFDVVAFTPLGRRSRDRSSRLLLSGTRIQVPGRWSDRHRRPLGAGGCHHRNRPDRRQEGHPERSSVPARAGEGSPGVFATRAASPDFSHEPVGGGWRAT